MLLSVQMTFRILRFFPLKSASKSFKMKPDWLGLDRHLVYPGSKVKTHLNRYTKNKTLKSVWARQVFRFFWVWFGQVYCLSQSGILTLLANMQKDSCWRNFFSGIFSDLYKKLPLCLQYLVKGQLFCKVLRLSFILSIFK